jgi:hypothetical protein
MNPNNWWELPIPIYKAGTPSWRIQNLIPTQGNVRKVSVDFKIDGKFDTVTVPIYYDTETEIKLRVLETIGHESVEFLGFRDLGEWGNPVQVPMSGTRKFTK